ncbi:MAG TPA: TlpA disulfide reductase family protein [Candidatus Angelobacter sp.]|nr:TlpA disulfide reductase family protein [Candidatus Angelobacter sp.]
MRFKILGALLLAGLVIFLLATQFLGRPAAINVIVQGGHATVGKPAPDFTTQTLDGSRVQLTQYRGKPVLLNFWATWCAPCQDEMPLIQRASDVDKGQGLVVLAVDYQQANTSSMKDFLRKVGARFPAVFDPSGQIAAEYGVNVGLPVSVFIDRSGAVSFIQLGQMSDVILQQHLHTIL